MVRLRVALRSFAVALAMIGAAMGASPVVAQGGVAETYTFAFREAEVSQVAQEVLGAVGAPYSIDPGVTGRISFRIEQRLTRDQLLAAFEAVLNAQGLSLVRNGEHLTITPQAKAKSAAAVRRTANADSVAGYEIVAVPLTFAEPSEVAKALEAISTASTVVYTSDRLGLILLGGTGPQLKTTMETMKVFDQNVFEDSKIRWFELSQAQATTVAGELERIIQSSKLAGVAVAPMRRLNGIVVFGRSAQSLNEIGRWIARLDTAGREATMSLYVYRPKAAPAESLSRTLNSLLGFQSSTETSVSSSGGPRDAGGATGSASASSTQSMSMGDEQVRIGLDKDTNALIVFASPGRWQQIQRILMEIDRTPKQVLIEASILEVTLTKDFQFGVDWSVLSGDVSVGSINNGGGQVSQSFPGLSVTFLQNGIEAAVSALGSRTTVEVVSAPKIIALDNKTANLQVGDQVPVVTQSAQGRDSNSALVNTVDYRSTGVILRVTPRVTGEDQLQLEVSQEVSNVTKTATSGIDSPTIQQRRFESTLVIPDGGVVALGGLISSTRNTGSSGVPGLKDLPVVGGLFSSQGRSTGRTELIILLKAKIIRDVATSRTVMTDLLDDMKELQGRGLLPTAP